MVTSDRTSVKIHVGPCGRVWSARGHDAPRDSGMKLDEYCANRAFGRSARVRLLGGMLTSSLLLHFYLLKINGHVSSLQVCTPACLGPGRLSPVDVIRSMRGVDDCMPASVGGWHEVDENDYSSCALSEKLLSSGYDDSTRRLLMDHPAWPAVSFISGLDRRQLSYVLAVLSDPRWYVDPSKPDRGARMESFMGLVPRVQKLASCGASGRNVDKCSAVLHSWKPKRRPNDGDLSAPDAFLLRIWAHHGFGTTADLRASQCFLSFIRHNWLAAIYRGRTAEPLFVPEHFFADTREAEAFKRHVSVRCPE